MTRPQRPDWGVVVSRTDDGWYDPDPLYVEPEPFPGSARWVARQPGYLAPDWATRRQAALSAPPRSWLALVAWFLLGFALGALVAGVVGRL